MKFFNYFNQNQAQSYAKHQNKINDFGESKMLSFLRKLSPHEETDLKYLKSKTKENILLHCILASGKFSELGDFDQYHQLELFFNRVKKRNIQEIFQHWQDVIIWHHCFHILQNQSNENIYDTYSGNPNNLSQLISQNSDTISQIEAELKQSEHYALLLQLSRRFKKSLDKPKKTPKINLPQTKKEATEATNNTFNLSWWFTPTPTTIKANIFIWCVLIVYFVINNEAPTNKRTAETYKGYVKSKPSPPSQCLNIEDFAAYSSGLSVGIEMSENNMSRNKSNCLDNIALVMAAREQAFTKPYIRSYVCGCMDY